MTNVNNLIISEENVPRLTLFQPRPMPEPGIALVLFREGKPVVVLWPGDRMTAGEVRWGDYKKIYKVNVAEQSFTFNCTLPCRGDAFDFHAQVQVTCVVNKPAVIVENKLKNVQSVLEPLITDTMRNVSRHYDVEDSEAAEREIATAVKDQEYGVGLTIKRFIVKLRLEDEARAHIRKLKQYDRDTALVDKEAQLQKQQDAIEIERMQMKMEFYGPLIKQGQWQLLAMQLSNRPEDVPAIIQMLNQQRQQDMDHQLKTLKIMLEEDVIEGFQLEETGQRVLQRLVDSLGSGSGTKALDAPQDSASESDE